MSAKRVSVYKELESNPKLYKKLKRHVVRFFFDNKRMMTYDELDKHLGYSNKSNGSRKVIAKLEEDKIVSKVRLKNKNFILPGDWFKEIKKIKVEVISNI